MNTIIKTASRLGQVEEYYFSRKLKEIAKMRAAGKAVINLGIGSPDLPPAQEVIDELMHHSQGKSNHAYQSYIGIAELREAFVKWYATYFGVQLDDQREVLPLIGSKEGIMHISMTYLEAGDEVLVPNPGYPAYSSVAKLTGASIRHYDLKEENDWFPDLKTLAEQDLSKVKIMWVNYPNMPTGRRASRTFFEELVAFAHTHQILICNDNPYAFILNEDPISILSIDGAKEVALELNSLSKSHNMAGWRVGMLAGKEDYVQTILRFKSNMDSGMFKPVQMAAAKALQLSKDWYSSLNEVYRERRELVFQMLDLLKCKYDRDQTGMFVWASIPNTFEDGFALSDEVLYNAHVFITPGGIFGSNGQRYIRISLCSDGAMLKEAMLRISKLAIDVISSS